MWLVLWKNGDVEIVTADDEMELAYEVLDQLCDPAEAVWQRVDFPVWLSVQLNEEGVFVERVDPSTHMSDERSVMDTAIRRAVYPSLEAMMELAAEAQQTPSPKDIAASVARDRETWPPSTPGWRSVRDLPKRESARW